MSFLGVCLSLLLWSFANRWDVAGLKFNPNCYVNRTAANPVSTRGLLKIDTILPPDTQSVTFETFAKPLDGCALDLYLKGSFYVVNLLLDLITIKCYINTKGYPDVKVTKISTGPTDRDKLAASYPDVPNGWWYEEATVLLLKIPQVNADKVGHYTCYARHASLANDVTMNISISVNGCPHGHWGIDCDKQCRCQNEALCNPWDGSCDCSKFWKGDTCETENPHVEMMDTNVYYGDNATLDCTPYFLEKTQLDIRWRLNGTYLNERSNVQYKPLVKLFSITIPSLAEKDSGMYTCEVTYKGNTYTASAMVSTTGCSPGWFGADCSRICNCQNNGSCERFVGCQCSDQYTGLSCELKKCADGVGREDCDPDSGENTGALGFGIGGGILALVFALIAIGLFRVKPWRVTIQAESSIDAAYFRNKDVTDLIQHKGHLVSDDVGVLWEHWALDESILFVGKQLDEGNFSTVYEGYVVNEKNFYNVAIKMLKNEKDSTAWQNFMGEFQILAHVCPHPNIVQLVGLCSKSVFNQAVTCVILEHMSLGSLYKVLHSNRHPETCDVMLTPGNISQIVLDIVRGMAKLEEMRYVHRDLATRNVLLTENMVAKISDFGLARDTYCSGGYQTLTDKSKKLPWRWMSFESLKDNVYTNKSDIWSFGVLLWEIATRGASPYPGVSNEGLLAYLEKDNRLECPTNCSKVWYAAMKICWAKDSDDRPIFTELLPFFTDLFSKTKNQSPFADEDNVDRDDRQAVCHSNNLDVNEVNEDNPPDVILEVPETEDDHDEELSVKNLINES